MQKTCTILVAEDSSATLDRFRRLAESLSPPRVHSIIEARDENTVRRALEAGGVDVVFLDVSRFGHGLLSEIRTLWRTVPVVPICSEIDNMTRLRLGKRGAYDLLKRPVDNGHLADILRNVISMKTERRALIVNRSADMRGAIGKAISHAMFNLVVAEADGFVSARSRMANVGADLVLCDLTSPAEDLFGFIDGLGPAAIQADILVTSAYPGHHIERRARDLGVRAFIGKSFQPEDLDAVLHAVYGLRPSPFAGPVQLLAPPAPAAEDDVVLL